MEFGSCQQNILQRPGEMGHRGVLFFLDVEIERSSTCVD